MTMLMDSKSLGLGFGVWGLGFGGALNPKLQRKLKNQTLDVQKFCTPRFQAPKCVRFCGLGMCTSEMSGRSTHDEQHNMAASWRRLQTQNQSPCF